MQGVGDAPLTDTRSRQAPVPNAIQFRFAACFSAGNLQYGIAAGRRKEILEAVAAAGRVSGGKPVGISRQIGPECNNILPRTDDKSQQKVSFSGNREASRRMAQDGAKNRH
jgi:hypothetical protein